MSKHYLYFWFIVLILFTLRANGQPDIEPPVAPSLTLVTVNYLTGDVEISWSLSSSPDVTGYIVYLYKNDEGYSIDTLYNPQATYYLRTGSGTSFFSESFVVAAFDSAGNTSPLSNALGTIYSEAVIDTCNKRIEISWNSYVSFPKQVLSYSVLCSIDNGSFTKIGETTGEETNFTVTGFITNLQYCFVVRAELEGGLVSGSNKTCVLTKMQQTPEWINADYATVKPDNSIELSFTIDPGSEIRTLQVERKSGSSGNFQWIAQLPPASGPLIYTDNKAYISHVNYYKASVVNNCKNPVATSNISSNMVLALSMDGNNVLLRWNSYRKWMGNVNNYKIFADTGHGWDEKATVGPGDTIFLINYSDLMYDITGDEICFMVRATEEFNPHGITGESQSSGACLPIVERITVPDIFTPDDNGINDFFRPILSFSPSDYHLIITDLRRKTVFETRDFNSEWDGKLDGNHLPEGTYLWFLKVRSPSGKNLSDSGTVVIVSNP